MSEELLAEDLLGREVKEFLLTNVGKYIDGCTQQDIQSATDEMMAIDPYAYTSLAELQNKISSIKLKALIGESLRGYMADAIVKGNQALHQLENEGQE